MRLAVRDGSGHGRHDDADHDVGAEDAPQPGRGPRVDAVEHPPADRRLRRRRGHVGDPDQRAQPTPPRSRARSIRDRQADHRGRAGHRHAAQPELLSSPVPRRSSSTAWPSRPTRSARTFWVGFGLVAADVRPGGVPAPQAPGARGHRRDPGRAGRRGADHRALTGISRATLRTPSPRTFKGGGVRRIADQLAAGWPVHNRPRYPHVDLYGIAGA